MPTVVNKDIGMQMSLGLRRNAMTGRLEVDLRLQTLRSGSVTTVQEGTFAVGEDQLFSRLQEHLNNYLRQLTNQFENLERTLR